ncbi:hypothetical protein CHL67_00540 [Prosthecochloris sp. GSB1]|nr:hypothetical protein CHL67_00540 [Prosthecochloris sp. GSB1]
MGKTTIASAAISVLCEQGRKTIGFKPYGARKFVDIIDADYPGVPGSLSGVFGRDAVKLATASNLTSLDDIDLITPVQSICYPEYTTSLVVRSGSTKAGNAEFFKGRNADYLEKRADYKKILKELGIENWLDFQRTPLNFLDSPAIGKGKIEDCFRHLIESRDVDTVVCEGAGRFLPYWNETKTVNHLFFVGFNEITLFRDINLRITHHTDKLLPVQGIVNILQKKKSCKEYLPFSRSELHDHVAAGTVRKLLGKRP